MSQLPSSIPSPPVNGFHVGPLFVHVYGLMYLIGISAAVALARYRWRNRGGDPNLVDEVAMWSVPAGIVGGRIYFDLTTPAQIPPHWWGPLAVWDGGLGIWGGVALAALVAIWRVRRRGAPVALFADALAPAILVAQAIGRVGNYFNQELFGGPTALPWGLTIAPQFRPPGYERYTTFQPTFLYEALFDLTWAALLILVTRPGRVRPPGAFALYVVGYSGFRIVEESLRIDYSQHSVFGSTPSSPQRSPWARLSGSPSRRAGEDVSEGTARPRMRRAWTRRCDPREPLGAGARSRPPPDALTGLCLGTGDGPRLRRLRRPNRH